MLLIHMMKHNWLYSKPLIKFFFTQKILTEIVRGIADHIPKHHGPDQVTYIIHQLIQGHMNFKQVFPFPSAVCLDDTEVKMCSL
jgi:hypothetical protein